MKTLELRHGDLVLGSAGHATVDGSAKVLQDVRGALLEPIGTDRFHPGFGSDLERQIGRATTPQTETLVQVEVRRVLDQYAAVQHDRLQRDALSGARSRYSTADVLESVSSIKTQQVEDRLYVQVVLSTADSTRLTLVTSVAT